VSGLGNDAHAPNCTRAAPCRTFQVAHNSTLANGEITVLDAGSYGSVTINRAISIINDGVGEAGALVSGGGTGITINAPADAAVSLRGLTIKGLGPDWGGGNGIVFNTGKSLTVENCVIRNLTGDTKGDGIEFWASAPSSLAVSNTLVADNQNSAISIGIASSGVKVVLNRVELYNSSGGLMATAGGGAAANVTVVDSVASGNNAGFALLSLSSGSANLVLVHSVVANNSTGVFASGANTRVVIGQSTVTGNTTAFTNLGATMRSFGDNYIDSNGSNGDLPPVIPTR
jgi:hypothetical protein